MTELVPAPEGDRQRIAEITEYLGRELASRTGEAPGIHVHYHAAPAPVAAPVAAPSRGQAALDNAVPYFIILLGGVVILACVGVIAVLLMPALLTMVMMIAIIMGGFALCSVAVAASVRSLRQSKTEQQVIKSVVKKRR